MMRYSLLLAALLATPALAQQPAAATDAKDPTKVICKRAPVVGQLVSTKKTCRTRAEWDAIRTDAQRDTQALQQMAPTNGSN